MLGIVVLITELLYVNFKYDTHLEIQLHNISKHFYS
jgi:hypothetical protein